MSISGWLRSAWRISSFPTRLAYIRAFSPIYVCIHMPLCTMPFYNHDWLPRPWYWHQYAGERVETAPHWGGHSCIHPLDKCDLSRDNDIKPFWVPCSKYAKKFRQWAPGLMHLSYMTYLTSVVDISLFFNQPTNNIQVSINTGYHHCCQATLCTHCGIYKFWWNQESEIIRITITRVWISMPALCLRRSSTASKLPCSQASISAVQPSCM